MKFAILILLATIVATQALRNLTEAEQDILADFRAECRRTIGITLAEGIELREGHFDTATEKQNCYLRCMATILGYIDANGAVNEKKLASDNTPLMGGRRAREVIKDCRDLRGKTDCDTIAKIYACHYAHQGVFSL